MKEQTAAAGIVYEVDFVSHELRRRTEILRALGPDWDPLAVLQGESDAYDLLYSGLDDEQLAVYERLVRAGVLPWRVGGSDAA